MKTEGEEIVISRKNKGGRREMPMPMKKNNRLSLYLIKGDADDFALAYKEKRRQQPLSRNTFAIDCIMTGLKQKSRLKKTNTCATDTLPIDSDLFKSILRQIDNHVIQMKGLGTNLNQLVKVANAPKLTGKSKALNEKQIAEILPGVDQVIKQAILLYDELQKQIKSTEL